MTKKPLRTHALARAVSRSAADSALPLLDRLNRRIAWLGDREPARAVRLAGTAAVIARAARLHLRPEGREVSLREADTCREAAFASSQSYDWAQADRWAERGVRAYRRAGVSGTREEARLDLVRAWILFNRGHVDEGHALAHSVLAFFRDTQHDLTKYVETQVYVASMFLRVGENDRALVLLGDAMRAGYGHVSERTFATIVYNAAVGAAEVGDPSADECFATACAHLLELGMAHELRVARVHRAEVLAMNARDEEAIAELDGVCGELYASGEAPLAAAASVSLLELLAKRGRTTEVLDRSPRALEILVAAGAELDAARLRAVVARCEEQ